MRATAPRAAPLRRVGHKGAHLIAPGNTVGSFDAALAAGVDMIEFDVLPGRWQDPDSGLFLAHDYEDLGGRERVTLAEGLDHLAAAGFAGIELDVDLKGPGYERPVVQALRARGMIERTLVSSQYVQSLRAVRELEPGLRLGWSVPRLRRDPLANPFVAPFALPVLGLYRAILPFLVSRALRAGRCEAIMAQHRLVTRRLVRAVARAGGDLYAWTVDEAPRIRALEAMGVTAVITNDPRLFAV